MYVCVWGGSPVVTEAEAGPVGWVGAPTATRRAATARQGVAQAVGEDFTVEKQTTKPPFQNSANICKWLSLCVSTRDALITILLLDNRRKSPRHSLSSVENQKAFLFFG